jgi:hypothetical protein
MGAGSPSWRHRCASCCERSATWTHSFRSPNPNPKLHASDGLTGCSRQTLWSHAPCMNQRAGLRRHPVRRPLRTLPDRCPCRTQDARASRAVAVAQRAGLTPIVPTVLELDPVRLDSSLL